MRLRVEGTPEELSKKAQTVMEHLAAHVERYDAETADQLRKALPAPKVKSEHKALQELQAALNEAYHETMQKVVEQALAAFEQETQAHAPR